MSAGRLGGSAPHRHKDELDNIPRMFWQIGERSAPPPPYTDRVLCCLGGGNLHHKQSKCRGKRAALPPPFRGCEMSGNYTDRVLCCLNRKLHGQGPVPHRHNDSWDMDVYNLHHKQAKCGGKMASAPPALSGGGNVRELHGQGPVLFEQENNTDWVLCCFNLHHKQSKCRG